MLIARSNREPFFCAVRRSARGVAALFAFMLIASNACAAMGLCIAKGGAESPAAVLAVADAPCPQHADDGSSGPAEPRLAAHCPQDDPSAQGRTADLPALAAVMAGEFVRLAPVADAGPVAAAAAAHPASSTPLYARLGRRLL